MNKWVAHYRWRDNVSRSRTVPPGVNLNDPEVRPVYSTPVVAYLLTEMSGVTWPTGNALPLRRIRRRREVPARRRSGLRMDRGAAEDLVAGRRRPAAHGALLYLYPLSIALRVFLVLSRIEVPLFGVVFQSE